MWVGGWWVIVGLKERWLEGNFPCCRGPRLEPDGPPTTNSPHRRAVSCGSGAGRATGGRAARASPRSSSSARSSGARTASTSTTARSSSRRAGATGPTSGRLRCCGRRGTGAWWWRWSGSTIPKRLRPAEGSLTWSCRYTLLTKNYTNPVSHSFLICSQNITSDWTFDPSPNCREGCSSRLTRTRTQCTRSATSARCSRSRSTLASWPRSPSRRRPGWELSTTWRAPTTPRDSPSTSSPGSFSQTQTRNEKRTSFCRLTKRTLFPYIVIWNTYNAPFERLLKLSQIQKSLISHLRRINRKWTLLG